MHWMLLLGLLGGWLLSGVSAANADEVVIHGAGASFPYPVYAWWGLRYGKQSGTRLIYDSIGSGGGVEHTVRTADFGASDAPLSQAELDRYGLMQFPTVLGGVVPVINLPGISKGTLRLTGPVLADLYLERIKRWNEAAIRDLDLQLDLPDLPVIVARC